MHGHTCGVFMFVPGPMCGSCVTSVHCLVCANAMRAQALLFSCCIRLFTTPRTVGSSVLHDLPEFSQIHVHACSVCVVCVCGCNRRVVLMTKNRNLLNYLSRSHWLTNYSLSLDSIFSGSLPGGTSGKEPTCDVGDLRDTG